MKTSYIALLFFTLFDYTLAATSTITVGDQVFRMDNERLLASGVHRTFYLAGESPRKWSRFVSVAEYYTVRDPKMYLVTEAKKFLTQVPGLEFKLSEDTATGVWLLDFVVPTSNKVQTLSTWIIIKARKAKKGIVVFHYAARFFYTRDPTEVAEDIAINREKLTGSVYDVVF